MRSLRLILGVLVVGVVVSFYFFPVGFNFLPERLNTKMILAVMGLLWYAVQSARTHSSNISRGLLFSIVIASAFSLLCLYSVDRNSTADYAYADYIVSFFVWLFGAYMTCSCIKVLHGKVTLRNVTAYLVAVSAIQCVLALAIDGSPVFGAWVDRVFTLGSSFLREKDRLYGIGAALDPAGVRFSIVLIMLFHLLAADEEVRSHNWLIVWYVVTMILIVVVGNMISRTTTAGLVLGVMYFILMSYRLRRAEGRAPSRINSIMFFILIFGTALLVYMYNTSPNFHKNMRFAFEGFFNLVETGVWRTDSTDKLNAVMWIWPETTDVWIWGTGLFDGWIYSTDIGYCRFILYCGLVGFGVFCFFFVQNAFAFASAHPECRTLAMFFLALTFVVWVKVATDIFLIYALLYHLDPYESVSMEEQAQQKT